MQKDGQKTTSCSALRQIRSAQKNIDTLFQGFNGMVWKKMGKKLFA